MANTGTISITLKAGQNLPIKDVLTRSSDPYAKIDHPGIDLPKHRWKSAIQYKTLNPVWEHDATCAINLSDRGVHITIEIWDADKVGKDEFMGEYKINIDNCPDDVKVEDQWVPLKAKKEVKKEKDLGKICISYNIQFGNGPARATSQTLAPPPDKERRNSAIIPSSENNKKLLTDTKAGGGLAGFLSPKGDKGKLESAGSQNMLPKPSQPAAPKMITFLGTNPDQAALKKYLSKCKNPAEEVNVQDKQGNSPLHLICSNKSKSPLLPALLEEMLSVPGINVNLKNSSDNTPLHYFCCYWSDPTSAADLLRTLVSKGSSGYVDATNVNGESPACKAILNHTIRKVILKELFTYNINASVKDSSGKCLLHFAAWQCRADLVELILEHSSAINVKDEAGLTPLDIVRQERAKKLAANPNDPLIEDWTRIEKKLHGATTMIEFLDASGFGELKQHFLSSGLDMEMLCEFDDEEIYSGKFINVELKVGQKASLIKHLKEYRETILPLQAPKKSLSQKIREAKGPEEDSKRNEGIDLLDKYLKDLHADKSINEFQLINANEIEYCDELGRGAFGAVWKGLLTSGEKRLTVAIKVLFEIKGAELESFKSEFCILNAVRDKNVVRMLGVCLNPKVGMVMEYCSNGSLQHVLKRKGIDFGWNTFFKMAPQIMAGIQILHQNKPQILHRDLKSLNILVTDTMEIRVADFGLARENTQMSSNSLKQVEGTVHYMPPELLSRIKYSTKSDVFSLSIILWEMAYRVLSGDYMRPYGDEPDMTGPASEMILYMSVANSGLRPRLPPTCPNAFLEVLKSAWASKPEDRPELCDLQTRTLDLKTNYQNNSASWPQVRYISNSEPVMRKNRADATVSMSRPVARAATGQLGSIRANSSKQATDNPPLSPKPETH